MTPKLSAEEIEIYSALGVAHTKWAQLEDALAHIFCEAVSVNPEPDSPPTIMLNKPAMPADIAFWEITSFDLRLRMTDAAVRQQLAHPFRETKTETDKVVAEWTKAHQRTRERNASRNKLAHGAVIKWGGSVHYYPFYYARLRGEGYNYYPDSGILVFGDIPKERLTKHNILSISRGFEVGTIRLGRFLHALRERNKAQSALAKAQMERVADSLRRADQLSTDKSQQPPPSDP